MTVMKNIVLYSITVFLITFKQLNHWIFSALLEIK